MAAFRAGAGGQPLIHLLVADILAVGDLSRPLVEILIDVLIDGLPGGDEFAGEEIAWDGDRAAFLALGTG